MKNPLEPRALGAPTENPLGSSGQSAALPSVRAFGKYFLVRKIAEGGMAEIFLAKQVGAEGFERNVVIKRMLHHLTSVSDFVNMFLDEARLASRLAHPNIIQINDLGLADGCYYICMEYLAGEDFSTVLRTAGRRREYVPLGIVLRVIADAAHGLHFAHEFADENGSPLNVVHRDVSPSNLYVTYQGQVKVLDFGIAKAESRVTQTTAGVVKGKYVYMAPEQARGDPVDRRADVYSLGVSLYEALTNVRPFARDNDLAILSAVLKGQCAPIRSLRPDLPVELEAIVNKAISPAMEDRYQTARALAEDLEYFLVGTTSASGTGLMASFLTSFFGPDRVALKTRIPTLAGLAASGIDVPGFSNPSAPGTDPHLSGGKKEDATVAGILHADAHRAFAVRAPQRRWPWLLTLFALAGTIGAGGAIWYTRFRDRPTTPVVGPTPVVEPAPAVVAPDAQEHAATVDAGAAVSNVIDAGSVVAAVAVLPQPDRPRPPKVAKVKLTVPLVEQAVTRQKGSVMKCFEEHRAELPPAGQVNVNFTIVKSGRVASADSGKLKGTPAGRCIEAGVKTFRFPAHQDSEVSLTLPFAYEIR